MTVRVKLNALDKNSNASHSMFIEVESVADFLKQEKQFEDNEVPFTHFYFDHEVDHDGSNLADEIEDNIV